MDLISTKHLLEEKCQTIEQLKRVIEELKLRHDRKEKHLMKHIGLLYNDLHQSKKKMAYLINKYQKHKKTNDISIQTEEQYPNPVNVEYISATPQVQSDHSLSLSTTDQSLRKHNESSSSAYNTGESLPTSSIYSDGNQSLERVLNAACTMYTTERNLEHTIKLQEELFRQHLRLRGIDLNDESEHFYDNIDSDTSDFEKQTISKRNRSEKKNRTVRFSLNAETKKSSEQKRKPNKKLFSSNNMLTVTIT